MLEGKIALVTGASRGIGRQIALALAAQGATVVVNYNGSAAKAEEVVNEITAAGGKAEAIQCNVADFDKCAGLMAGILKQYGRLDILVNNAGITRDNLLMKMSEEDFDAVIQTNLKGVFNCVKHVSRQMLKQKSGRIINISSVSGVLGNAGQAQLLRGQGRRDRTDQVRGQGAGQQRDHRKRGGARLYQHRHDRVPERRRKGRCGGADPHEAFRRDGRCGESWSRSWLPTLPAISRARSSA